MIGTWEFEHLFLAGQYWRGVLLVTESGIGTFYLTLVCTYVWNVRIGTWEVKHLFLAGQYWRGRLTGN